MTADLTRVSLENRRRWLEAHSPTRRPVFVARDASDQLVGYASLSDYREGRAALLSTAEVSLYVELSRTRQGIGSLLLRHVIEQAPSLGIDRILAIVLATNQPSIALLSKHDFKLWGRLPGVATIDGSRVDHLYLGLGL